MLQNTDFVDMRPLVAPLIHTICLVYSHSKYYNSTARIIILMQVIAVSWLIHASHQNDWLIRKCVISLLRWPESLWTLKPSSMWRQSNLWSLSELQSETWKSSKHASKSTKQSSQLISLLEKHLYLGTLGWVMVKVLPPFIIFLLIGSFDIWENG